MYAWKRRRVTLLPAVALVGLGALVALPTLSQARFYAATPAHFTTITVAPGESLWAIADRYTPADGNPQETIDRILAANRLRSANLFPGERLRIPR